MNKYKLKQAVQIGLAAMVLGVLPLSRPVQAAEETKQLSFKERVQAIANARKEDFALKSEEIRAKRRGDKPQTQAEEKQQPEEEKNETAVKKETPKEDASQKETKSAKEAKRQKPEKPQKEAKTSPRNQAAEAETQAEDNTPVNPGHFSASELAGLTLRPSLEIEGKKLVLTEPINFEESRQRSFKDRAVKDPSLQLILNRVMTKSQLWNIPKDYDQVTIAGEAEATRDQAVALLKLYNNRLPIKATPEQLVEMYYNEAGKEGIRWDLAFCQALLETGFFHFGGTVVPAQNNFCGLGTTSSQVRGAYFATPDLGVRAHIQHLMAYSTSRKPSTPIVDPRYQLVYDGKVRNGFFDRWSQLNGKWATGSNYAEKIMNIHEQMKSLITVSGADWPKETR